MVWLDIAVFIIGLVVLVKAADYTIGAATKLARFFGISNFVIGLTLVAVGTSLPELASSIIAIQQGNPGIALGNILGSNIANVGLVLGLAALVIGEIKVPRKVFDKDVLLLFGITLLFYVLAFDGAIGFLDGIFLLAIFVYYFATLFKFKPAFKTFLDFRIYLRFVYGIPSAVLDLISYNRAVLGLRPILKQLAVFAVGTAGIILGANYAVGAAANIASTLNVSSELIGLTLVAIGTSAPELAIVITSLKKNLPAMSFGALVGSNMANLLLIGGLSALLVPLATASEVIANSLFFLAIVSILLVFTTYGNWNVNRREALFLLTVYGIFIFGVI